MITQNNLVIQSPKNFQLGYELLPYPCSLLDFLAQITIYLEVSSGFSKKKKKEKKNENKEEKKKNVKPN